MKHQLAKTIAGFIHKKEQKWISNPWKYQEKWFKQIVQSAKETQFGKDHSFHKIKTIQDFQKHVHIRDYEGFSVYIQAIIKGEENILWPGKPNYLLKTSGTTSGAKYIPLTKESLPFHIKAARNALLNYAHFKNGKFFQHKMIFLQGSPELDEIGSIKTGRLSGVVAHYVPNYLQKNRMPSWETNCMEDWETKVDAIVKETQKERMSLISGIPPWLIMYFEKLIEQSGKQTIKDIFPDLQLLVTGGVNYAPYRDKINALIGEPIDVIQTFPASEGFFAYQDQIGEESLLLLANHGMFYEFVPLEEIHQENPSRLILNQVELDKDYALIITTNAGLYAYNIGDTVRFVSKNPYRLVVSGRIKHYTSAFGEHVIAHEVETAMKNALNNFPAEVKEFTVAPQVNPTQGLPYHEWLIEFAKEPENLDAFAQFLDEQMCALNLYYKDLIEGKVLKPLLLTTLPEHSFENYMKSQGKLGGQNKVPRLKNDREVADSITQKIIS